MKSIMTVRVFRSSNLGMPQLAGVVGSFIPVLDLLVNGSPAYPVLTRTGLYFQEYFTERPEDGTWTDELWAPLPVGGSPFDSRLQFDPGDNGLQSVTISNIEVYSPV